MRSPFRPLAPAVSAVVLLWALTVPAAAQPVASRVAVVGFPASGLPGQAAGEAFGSSVAPAGDVNGDGHADLIVGAPGSDLAGTDAGPEVLPTLGQEDATGFLNRALAFYGRLGATVERVMTDNGGAYRSKLFAKAMQQAKARHVRTRPYTPRTNGKAERFIQTSLREWAYARPYASSAERTEAIAQWADTYNLTRPHAGIGGISPFQKLNNLLGNDT